MLDAHVAASRARRSGSACSSDGASSADFMDAASIRAPADNCEDASAHRTAAAAARIQCDGAQLAKGHYRSPDKLSGVSTPLTGAAAAAKTFAGVYQSAPPPPLAGLATALGTCW